MRDKIIYKTHGEVFKKVRFFQNRERDFTSLVVHELKPVQLGANDLLFSQGDEADCMYFMHFGKIKLHCDLNDLINDDYTLTKMIEYEKLLISLQKNAGDDEAEIQKPS